MSHGGRPEAGRDRDVGNRGYAMAALLVAMSVMAVLLTVAMPVYKQMSRREKEEELVFRGLQYARAIRLYGMKFANAAPPSIDVLVEQRYLRKKYKDPITNDDFQPILAGGVVPGASGGPGQSSGRSGSPTSPQGSSSTPGRGTGPGSAPGTSGRGGTTSGSSFGTAGAGITGVTSKSKDESIRIYNGRNHYNEWAFVYVPQVQAPGAGAPGTAAPGQRGGPPGQQQNPFGSGIGGQRGGRGSQPTQPPGGQRGPQGGRGGGPGTFQPFQPVQPVQPIQPGRGRG